MTLFKGTLSSNAAPAPELLALTRHQINMKAALRTPKPVWSAVESVERALGRLAEHWQEDALGGDETAMCNQLAAQSAELYKADLMVSKYLRRISAASHQSLELLLGNASAGQAHRLSAGGRLLHGCYVLGRGEPAPSELPPFQSEYFVWLWTPANGIEQFRTLGEFKASLGQRLKDPEVLALYLPDPMVARGNNSPGELTLQVVNKPLIEDYVAALLQLQRNSLKAFQAAGQPREFEKVWHLAAYCAGLDAQLLAALRHYRAASRPDWLRNASVAEQQVYCERETEAMNQQQAFDAIVEGTSTLQVYARRKVGSILSAQLKLDADPDAMILNTAFRLARRGTVTTVRRKLSLTDYALQELGEADLKVSTDEALQARGLSPEFLYKMHGRLDLRVRYQGALEREYARPATLKALGQVLQARLALALLAARYRERRHVQFESLEQACLAPDAALPGHVQIGRVQVTRRKLPLLHLLVFGVGEGDARKWVVYAPGAPSGNDFSVFDSQDQWLRELDRWLLVVGGREFLIRQAPSTYRGAIRAALRPVIAGAVNTVEQIDVQWYEATTFNEALEQYAKQKAAMHVDEYADITPAWYREAQPDARRRLAVIDRNLQILRGRFDKDTQLTPFMQFAREDVQAKLDALRGTPRHDCDQVIIHYEPHGDVSLMQAALRDLRFDTPFVLGKLSSSVGKSVDGLAYAAVLDIAENANLANRYMAMIKTRFLDPGKDGYDARLELFFDISRHEMERAVITQHMQWMLDGTDAKVLSTMVAALHDLEPPIVGGDRTYEKTGVYRLGLDGRCVQGVYIFRHLDEGGVQRDYLYTPHSPDGVWFRPLRGFRLSLKDGRLQDYYYARVRHSDKPRIGSLLQRWKDSSYPEHLITPAAAPYDRVSNFREEFIVEMAGLSDDVDKGTTTAAERASEAFESLALRILNLAPSPFPPAAMALSVLITARSVFNGVKAYQDGDRAAAFWHLVDVAQSLAAISGLRGYLKQSLVQVMAKELVNTVAINIIDEIETQLLGELTNFVKSQVSERIE